IFNDAMIPPSLFGAVILTAVLVAAILIGRGQDNSSARLQPLAWPLGLALAFFVGALVYSGHPHWPLYKENEDRFLAFLLPLAALVEGLALFVKPWLVWPGRLLVALAAGPILLYGSSYLQTWTTSQACLWLGCLAGSVMLAWVSLDLQIRYLP